MKKMMFNDRYGLTEAVIEKRKNLTRRLVKIDFGFEVLKNHVSHLIVKNSTTLVKAKIFPPYQVGEIVAVAQSYQNAGVHFIPCDVNKPRKWGCSFRMKGWSNKMFVIADLMPHKIRILDVRVEQLQDITDEDCLREGINKYTKDKTVYKYDLDDGFEMFPWRDMKRTSQEAFAVLIDKISGKGTWERNPFVWRIEFELID